ncbi:unnamed protein product [Mytilus coruscus]|uniref:Uncharacterized protein n=1 Tax=Mytilus coruscus TaxID=42192 RepID=A0A6J8C7H1_MYTCO|nr:unnamed protein product [Mytilus coruscus]
MNFEHQLNIMSLQITHNTEVNELKYKLYHMENECNKYKTSASGNQQSPSEQYQMNTQFVPFSGSQYGNLNQQSLNLPQIPNAQWTRPQYGLDHLHIKRLQDGHDTRPKNNQRTRQIINAENHGQNRVRTQMANQKLSNNTKTNSERVHKQQTQKKGHEYQYQNKQLQQTEVAIHAHQNNQKNIEMKDMYTKNALNMDYSINHDTQSHGNILHHRSLSEPVLNNEQMNSTKPFLGAGRASTVKWTKDHLILQ